MVAARSCVGDRLSCGIAGQTCTPNLPCLEVPPLLAGASSTTRRPTTSGYSVLPRYECATISRRLLRGYSLSTTAILGGQLRTETRRWLAVEIIAIKDLVALLQGSNVQIANNHIAPRLTLIYPSNPAQPTLVNNHIAFSDTTETRLDGRKRYVDISKDGQA